ncbi:MAG: glycosyltransferase [Acidobacteria bacterium]|nr:glycosyltransferase [Acidobacteriota bacterium]
MEILTAGLPRLALIGSYLMVLAVLSVFGLHRWQLLVLTRNEKKKHRPARPLPGPLPVVTVQLPIYNEPRVARRLLMAVARLDYPRHLLEIQVLDDSTDHTAALLARLVARLRRRRFQVSHLRRTCRTGFKAGALAAGLEQAQGRFIAIFDADFLPPPGFLRTALPPFAEPGVGMVQARWTHLNRRNSILTRVQATLLDGHFLVEHLARYRSGRFFNFNGTAGIWRRECIDTAGGWQADTLTEDLDLSYRAQLAGWRFVFLPHLVAPAELPAGVQAWKTQQHRWAKGSVETARKLLPRIWHAPLSRPIRWEAIFHLTANGSYLFMVLLCLLIWPTLHLRQHGAAWILALVDLAVLGLATASVFVFYYRAQRRAGQGRAASLLCLPPLLGLGAALAINNSRAVLEALLGRRSPFRRTPKEGRLDTKPGHGRPVRAQGPLPYLEGLMSLYLAATFLDAIRLGVWAWVPFIGLFLWGHVYLTVADLGQALRAWRYVPAR